MSLPPSEFEAYLDDAFAFKSKKLLERIMGKLTPMEQEALDLCQELIITFGPGKKMDRLPYRLMMNRVADVKRKLENIKLGCPTGAHYACHCERKQAA